MKRDDDWRSVWCLHGLYSDCCSSSSPRPLQRSLFNSTLAGLINRKLQRWHEWCFAEASTSETETADVRVVGGVHGGRCM